MEVKCSKYKPDLYNSNKDSEKRLIFPKETTADFVYNTETNQTHTKLFSDTNNQNGCLRSETQKNFTYREPEEEIKGARRRALEEFLIKQAAREVMDEQIRAARAPPDYKTEYNSKFTLSNFVPNDFFSRDRNELSLKYPVYGTGSNPVTCYSHGYQNKNNLLNPFKRYGTFTKPMHERFDVDTS